TIPAHRPQDHITLEMAPLEIRHRSVRPISAKHAQASRFLQQSLIEADHGKLKILIKPVRGFKSIPTAYAALLQIVGGDKLIIPFC
ncbi:hypothetical protein RCF08_28305, partial [Klebsiella pneumoniae]|nr:hypothetical protein [Klebsiella pneumoniae]